MQRPSFQIQVPQVNLLKSWLDFNIINVNLEAYITYKISREMHSINLLFNKTFLTQETYTFIFPSLLASY